MRLTDIYAARKRIRNLIRETPLVFSSFFNDLCKAKIWLKLENLQLTGSFKIRGAFNKLLNLNDKERNKGVVSASSGNHAQGLGYASKKLGVESTIVVPTNTPKVKIDEIKRYDVELIIHGDEYIQAENFARKIGRERNKIFVSAYNDIDIVTGQGTIGLEMLEEQTDFDAILVPVGGGGLISGVGCAVKSINKDIELIGVQSVVSPVMYESIQHGHIIEMDLEESIAEGLHGGIEKNSITFIMCMKYVDDFILVKEESILSAINLLLTKQHIVVEGAGAVGIASILENPDRFYDRRVGIIISGGNIGTELIRTAVNLTL